MKLKFKIFNFKTGKVFFTTCPILRIYLVFREIKDMSLITTVLNHNRELITNLITFCGNIRY